MFLRLTYFLSIRTLRTNPQVIIRLSTMTLVEELWEGLKEKEGFATP